MKGSFVKTLGGWKPADPETEKANAAFALGEVCPVDIRKTRNPQHHKKAMAMLQLVYDNQERYPSFTAFLDEIKLKCGHYREHVNYKRNTEGEYVSSVVYIPESISFGSMDQAKFSGFYDKMVNVILTDILPGIGKDELETEVLNFESTWAA
jgi:hypothetical protein